MGDVVPGRADPCAEPVTDWVAGAGNKAEAMASMRKACHFRHKTWIYSSVLLNASRISILIAFSSAA